ncbi:hypothetical protein WME75_29250 [Sorangium sp. So ce1014]|uniref:hypothetical protein n=1 Tax=Sorangium sp. So ce1014 TaxID=3133326 RepID=UPI003F62D562
MSPKTREDLLRRFARVDDPEIEARSQWILQALLAHSPEVKEQLIEQGVEKGIERGIETGQLTEARALLHRVLARRGFTPTAAMETRIDACSELDTLHRWLDQAMTSASAEEALA